MIKIDKGLLTQFFELRFDALQDKIILGPKCNEITDRICQLQHKIISELPPGCINILLGYEEAQIDGSNIIQEEIYKKGVMDGIQLSNLCAKISRI